MKTPNMYKTEPPSERKLDIAAGLFLLVWGASGFWTDTMRIQDRRGNDIILEGRPAWLLALAAVLGAAVLLSVVVDYYDGRDNERHYRTFRWVTSRLAWCAAAGALMAHAYLAFFR
jgi:hypothetical protein